MWCKPNLTAVVSNGQITISGKVELPNPSYSATLESRDVRDDYDLTLKVNTRGGIAPMMTIYADVTVTIPDEGQHILAVSVEGAVSRQERLVLSVLR